MSEIYNLISRMYNQKLDLTFRADFPMDFTELPDGGPIRTLSAETKVAGIEVQLTAGVLKLSGTRISEISWHRIGTGRVMVTMDADLEATVTPQYLIDGHLLLERYFRVLVLGRPTETP
jgi:hypothetical protein